MDKYTIKDFNKQFPNDNACLHSVFLARYKDSACPGCKRQTNFYKLNNRKAYSCQFCGYNLFPLANTIFHKSDTSLKSWFYAIFLMSQSRNGVSAMELQRHLGVTYKTAWRMAKQIRLLMEQDGGILSGTVEADETYIGGKKRGTTGRGSKNKTPVVGMVQRKGNVKAKAVIDTTRYTVTPLIKKNVAVGTDLMTDDYIVYSRMNKQGYKHKTINHSKGKYVNGNIHTNTIEGFWSQLKRSIDGTYHAVSPKYLQSYVDEFSFRYNHRTLPVFPVMLLRACLPYLKA